MSILRAPSACLLLLAVLAGCKAVPAPRSMESGTNPSGQVSLGLLLGQSTLHSDEEFPVESEDLLGLALRFIDPAASNVGVEMGYNYRKGSNANETIPGVGTFDFHTRADEVFVGLWAPIVTKELYHPYIGVGGSMYAIRVHGNEFNVSTSDKDVGYGVYARVGVLFDLTDHLQWGIDVRGVLGNRLNLFGARTYGDFTQAALTVVYGF